MKLMLKLMLNPQCVKLLWRIYIPVYHKSFAGIQIKNNAVANPVKQAQHISVIKALTHG